MSASVLTPPRSSSPDKKKVIEDQPQFEPSSMVIIDPALELPEIEGAVQCYRFPELTRSQISIGALMKESYLAEGNSLGESVSLPSLHVVKKTKASVLFKDMSHAIPHHLTYLELVTIVNHFDNFSLEERCWFTHRCLCAFAGAIYKDGQVHIPGAIKKENGEGIEVKLLPLETQVYPSRKFHIIGYVG